MVSCAGAMEKRGLSKRTNAGYDTALLLPTQNPNSTPRQQKKARHGQVLDNSPPQLSAFL